MLIRVNRSMVVPLVDQIRDQIVAAITTGDLKAGERLPPIRQLAQFLGINRNTVGQAYRLLEHEGYLVTRAGGGTMIADSVAVDTARGNTLRQLIRSAIAEATTAGFTAKEFAELACYEAATEAEPPPQVASILVIDHASGELDALSAATRSSLPDCVVSEQLLAELAELDHDARARRCAGFDFALVPFYCLEDAAELLDGVQLPVVAAGVGPSLTVLDTIRRAVTGQRVALVCTAPDGPARMAQALQGAGVALPSVEYAQSDQADLPAVLAGCDLIIASEGSAGTVEAAVPDKPMIVYSAMLKQSSLRTIRGYLNQAGRPTTWNPTAITT